MALSKQRANRLDRQILEKQERTRALLASPASLEALMVALSEGELLKEACARLVVDYAAVRRYMVRHHRAEYEAVQAVLADAILEDIAGLEDDLRQGRIEPAMFRELTSSKKWRAEKLNPGRYGPRQNVDMRVQDVGRMQLDAIRQLAGRKTGSLPTRPALEALPAPAAAPNASNLASLHAIPSPTSPPVLSALNASMPDSVEHVRQEGREGQEGQEGQEGAGRTSLVEGQEGQEGTGRTSPLVTLEGLEGRWAADALSLAGAAPLELNSSPAAPAFTLASLVGP